MIIPKELADEWADEHCKNKPENHPWTRAGYLAAIERAEQYFRVQANGEFDEQAVLTEGSSRYPVGAGDDVMRDNFMSRHAFLAGAKFMHAKMFAEIKSLREENEKLKFEELLAMRDRE